MAGKLLTARQLEERYGVSEARWLTLARQDLCPHVRLGRQVRFLPEQIEDWILAGGQALPGGWRQEPAEAR